MLVSDRKFDLPKLLVTSLALAFLLLNWLPSVDAYADEILDQMLADGLIVYASARGLNAVISVLQSLEMSLSFGAGVAIQFGEILDPLNDLIERFSAFLLYGLVALGFQEFIHTFFSAAAAKWLVSIALIFLAASFVLEFKIPRPIRLVLVGLLVFRIGVLAQVALGGWLEEIYFSHNEQIALEVIDDTADEFSAVQEGYTGSEGIGDQWFSMFVPTQSPAALLSELQERTNEASKAILDLMLLFLLKGFVFPAVYFYCLYQLFKTLLKQDTFVP